MKLSKFLPAAPLLPFIREYLIIESDQEISNTTIPDTSLVLSFRYSGTVLQVDGDHQELLPATSISGLRKSARTYCYTQQTANLLVVCKEGGISAFSGLPAHELFSHIIPSENLFLSSRLKDLLEQLAAAEAHSSRITLIESFLLSHLIKPKTDPLIDHAIRHIVQQNGLLKIKDLATSLHISQDPLEKRFRALVGTTPKQYAGIIRLRHLIKQYPSYSSLTDASYEAGYFDQSHFIRDFRLFTGRSPKAFFKDPRFW